MSETPQNDADVEDVDLEALPDPDAASGEDDVHQMPIGEVHPDDEGKGLADHEVGQILADPVADDGRSYEAQEA